MAVETPASLAGGNVRVRHMSHFTLPVRDRHTAARFYTAVFNADVDHASDPDRVKEGKARSLQVGVRLCAGIDVDLFEQDYGQPAITQSHPHYAFEVEAEDVASWIERLTYWRVPFAGPLTRSGTEAVEIYFRDPDGNNLELHCTHYPAKLRASLPTGPYDRYAMDHRAWPAPDLEEEAERLYQGKVAAMQARKDKTT